MPVLYDGRREKVVFILLAIYAAAVFMFDADESKIRYMYLAYIVLCVVLMVRSGGISINRGVGPLMGYLLFGLVSIIWSYNRSTSLVRVRGVFLLLVFLILMTSYSRRKQIAYGIVVAIIVGTLALSGYIFFLYGITGVIGAVTQGNIRLGWLVNNVNAIANSLAVGIISMVGVAVNYRKRLLYFLLVPVSICFLAAGSRTATITVVLGILLVIRNYIRSAGGDSRRISVVIGFIMILPLIWLIIRNLGATEDFVLRLENSFRVITGKSTILKENSIQTRIEYLRLGWEQFLKSPLVGNGIGNAGYAILNEYGYVTYLHNNYMEMLASGGIIGFVLFYSPYFICIKSFTRRLKQHQRFDPLLNISFVLLIVRLVGHMGMVVYYSKIEYLLLALWITVLNTPEEQYEEKGITCSL